MKRILSALAVASAFTMTPAYAVTTTFNVGDPEFQLAPGQNIFSGTITAGIQRSNIPGTLAGTAFTDIFEFTIPQFTFGLGSGSLSTSTTALLTATDLDFISVLVNGVAVDVLTSVGQLGQTAFEFNAPITGFNLNTLTVNGVSRGNGSYGGQITFTPTGAIPEPATWAMLILGFAVVGFSMRRRSKANVRVRFAV